MFNLTAEEENARGNVAGRECYLASPYSRSVSGASVVNKPCDSGPSIFTPEKKNMPRMIMILGYGRRRRRRRRRGKENQEEKER